MAYHSDLWLLDPVFPAPAALPRLDEETEELARLEEAPSEVSRYPSGTWRLAVRVDDARAHDDHASDERGRKSPSDAPTVRPGSLHALKTA
jgi:hypothetical protein